MNLVVVASALSGESELKSYAMQAAFRKASKKMIMCFDAVKKAIAIYASVFTIENLGRAGLILNSGFGEIEATGGFLKGLAETGVARPIFFQNSLHNSTTGFLAIQYGIKGPVLTVNHRTQGGDEALELASSVIAESLCEFCFLVSVETVPVEFAGETGVGREGAAALIVCTEETAKKYSLPIQLTSAQILDEQSREQTIALPLKGLKSLFQFDLVARLADRIAEQDATIDDRPS